QVKLEESGGGLVQAEGSLRLSCVTSGRIEGILLVGWYRQGPGKQRDVVASIDRNGNTRYDGSAEGRFTIARENANTVYLQMNNLRPEDSNVYVCGALSSGVNPWAWGQGTQVTVSSENLYFQGHHHHHH
uniref:nanobody VHH R326 n=1 Tax=Lama glama TaxID=9844 RepID=UPI000DE7BE08|nr:Chain A, nanobody VHH R326 [Lama glama]6DBD_B Chain B, nanobody VHH R326 [Lama glama]6DBD_C Chain C, nanobody VHH R326 [Lama glama]6DBD_D Chain D, nanobody VHH R326 [Lama glama]